MESSHKRCPQCICLGTGAFRIFINDIDSVIKYTLCKLSGAVETIGGRDTIQRDLDLLKNWAHVKLIRFSEIKCKILHLGQGNLKTVNTSRAANCQLFHQKIEVTEKYLQRRIREQCF